MPRTAESRKARDPAHAPAGNPNVFSKAVASRLFAAGRICRRTVRCHTGERRELRVRVLEMQRTRVVSYTVLPTPTEAQSS